MDGFDRHYGSHTRYKPTLSLLNLGTTTALLSSLHKAFKTIHIYSLRILHAFRPFWHLADTILVPFLFPGAAYSPPSPLELHYSDSTSSIYPDRPIRPLPKRRLRSRLSSEIAESILYPPATALSKPLFQFPYNDLADQQNDSRAEAHSSEMSSSRAREQRGGDTETESYQFKGAKNGSDDEDGVVMARRYQEQRQRSGGINSMLRNNHMLSRSDATKYVKSPIPQSTTSSADSVDGYDSFENTNNKKKRKIPTSGSLGSHQSSLSAEMAQMGISSARDVDLGQSESDSGVGHYYGTGNSALPAVSSGTGISGAGRGRYGRAGMRYQSGRSPLGVSVNGSNTLQAGRSLHLRRDHMSSSSAEGKGNTGFHPCFPSSSDM